MKMIRAETAEMVKPRMRGLRGFSVSDLALTKKVPRIDVHTAPERARSGKTTPLKRKSEPPKIMAATIVTAYAEKGRDVKPGATAPVNRAIDWVPEQLLGSSSGMP